MSTTRINALPSGTLSSTDVVPFDGTGGTKTFNGSVILDKEDKGYLTIGSTQYAVRVSTTDAGAAGYITFVVEA